MTTSGEDPRAIAAVDIGGTRIKLATVATADNRILTHQEVPARAGDGAAAVLDRVTALLRTLDFDGLGVCSGGQIAAGRVIHATDNLPGLTGLDVVGIMGARFPVPVLYENDVNAAAVGEGAFGAARGYRNFIMVTYGTGIGGAIVIEGRLHAGAHGGAGEFGHLVTHTSGRRCTCGCTGCYEAYASTAALTRLAETRTGRPLDGRGVVGLVKTGDALARGALDEWLTEVAVGLAGLIHAINPEAVILGGGIMEEPLVTEALIPEVHRRTMPSYRHTVIQPAELGNTAGLLGMYHLVRSDMDEPACQEPVRKPI